MKNTKDKSCKTNCDKTDQMCLPETSSTRIVVIGGGFAGLSFIKGLKNKAVQLVLIDKNNFHQFQPLLYQVATSGLEPDNIAFPFRKQFRDYKHVIFRMAEVLKISTQDQLVFTDKGFLSYDYLVLATGTSTNFFGMENIEKHALGMKSITDALDIRHSMLRHLEEAAISCDEEEREALTNFVIVGGGPAGIEMAGALAEFRKYILPKDYPEYPASIAKIYLVEGGPKLLPAMSESASAKSLKYLKELEVEVLLNEIVTDYRNDTVLTKSGRKIPAKNLIWTAGVKGEWPSGIGDEQLTFGNRIKTNGYLQVEGMTKVFALGDVSAVITEKTPKGHPQVAQAAIPQGAYLAKAILKIMQGQTPAQPFTYKDKGSLATVGRRRAVADLRRLKFGGYLAWWLWSLVHLMSISGFKNKVLVAINWAISYFSYEKSNRLIIRKGEN